MKFLIPGAAALLLAPAAFAQTTTPAPQTNAPMQTTTPAPTDQASPDAQSMSTATDSSGAGPSAAPVKPTVGATVYGSAGTPVGTIKAMDPKLVTLTTAKGDIRLPLEGIGAGPNGPMIAMTAEQLNAAIDQAKAAQPVAKSKTTSAATRKRR